MSETVNTAEIRIVADSSGVESGLRQATTAAERAERQITTGANNSARSQGNLIAAIQRTTAQMESGGRAGSRYFEILAQQRGVDPRALEPYLRQLRALEQAQQRAGQSAAQTNNAMRQLPAQLTDVLTSLQGGQSPLTVLLQQGGQVTDSFGGVGAAVRAVGSQVLGLINPVTLAAAAIGGLGYAYYAGGQEARAYNLAIATTGNAAGTSAALMAEAAAKTADFIGSQSGAAEVLASMAATGQISGQVMVELSTAALRAQRDLGREVSTSVEEFAALGKDPVKALADLVTKYHHVTAATYAQVKALQDEGRAVEAATLAQKAHADGINNQSGRVVENLGYIESAWKSIKNRVSETAGEVKDFFLDLGREETLADLTERAAKIQKNIDLATDRKDGLGKRTQQALLDSVNAQIAAKEKELGLSKQQAEEEARRNRADALRIEITNGLDSLLSREQLRTRDLAAARTKAAEAGLSEAETQQLLSVVRKKYSDIDEAAQKKREAAAKAAAEALKKEAALLAELAGLTPDFAADWDRLSKAYAKGALSLDQLTKAQADLLDKQPGIKKANDEQVKALAESDKLYEQGIKTAEQYLDSLLEQVKTQRDSTEQIGLTGPALADLVALRLESAAAQKEESAAAIEALEPGSQLAAAYRAQAQALLDLASAKKAGAAKAEFAEANKKDLEELNKFLDPSRAQTFGEALREAFGTAGQSLSKLTATLDGFGKRQAEIDKMRNIAEKNRGKGDFDEVKYQQTILELNKRRTQDQLASYGSMASAAAGFFGEQSKGYQALMTVSKVFHAAELAMTLAELVPKGISAVLGQGQGDPYSAFGRMAAMAAIVAGLGVAIGGIGGGAPSMSEARQKSQGTGTVLGSDDKSQSISRSLDMIEKAAFQGLEISNSMLGSLRNIESGIGAFASQLVGSSDVGRVDVGPLNSNNGGATTAFGVGTGAALGSYFGPIGTVIGAVVGLLAKNIPVIGKIATSIFGGKETVQDSGLSIGKVDFASILAGRLDAMKYADVKVDGGWFRKDKTKTRSEDLGADAERQITGILTSLYDSVFEAGKLLGIGADEFSSKLNGFVVDIGEISLKGLSGEEVQKELEAVFSKVGDQLAQYGVGGLESFQKVGEGYLETLTRVATGYQTVTVVTDALGMTFGSMGLASIAARERLIDLAGGLDEFTSSAEQFLSDFYTDKEQAEALRARLQPTLDRFGIQSGADDSLEQFRGVVKNLKLETAEGAQAFADLMQIMPAFKQLADFDKAKFEERLELQDKYDQLTMTAAQLLDKQRGALDESNRALFDQVRVLEERAGLQEQLDNLTLTSEQLLLRQREALDGSNQSLFDQIQLATRAKQVLEERKSLQEQLDSLTMTSAQQLEKQRNALDESNRALFDQVQAAKAQKEATDKAAQAIKAASEAAASAIKSFGDGLLNSMNRARESAQALRDFNDALLLGNLSTLNTEEKYRAAKRQFEAADPTDTQAAQAFLQASKDRGGDSFYYERDFAMVQQKLAQGAAALDKYADSIPSFWLGYLQSAGQYTPTPAPVVTQVATPPVVQQTATMSKSSAQQADITRIEAKVDALASIGDTMQEIARSTADTAKFIGKVTDKGTAMRVGA